MMDKEHLNGPEMSVFALGLLCFCQGSEVSLCFMHQKSLTFGSSGVRRKRFLSVASGGHLYLVCVVCDIKI